MVSGKIITGFMIDEGFFARGTDAEQFVLQRLREPVILKFLTYRTSIYEEGVQQFFLNATIQRSNFSIKSYVGGNRFQISTSLICSILGCLDEMPKSGDLREINHDFLVSLGFSDFDNVKVKKSCLSEEGRIPTDIVRKCIICKETTHDTLTQT